MRPRTRRHPGPLVALAAYVETDGGGDEGEQPEEVQGDLAAPDGTWLNEEIAQYARDNGIDLEGATRKNEMLNVIQEAGRG